MIVALAVPPFAVAFLVFYFLRSSKDMPKNWREFVVEMKIQASGTQGLTEDTIMILWNKVDKDFNSSITSHSNYFFKLLELVKRPNKVAVMTGGNRGIGLHVIDKLLKCDMIVMLGVRNPEASRKSVEDALGTVLTKGKVFYEKCDTGDLESVKSFASKVQAQFAAVHVLINNGKDRNDFGDHQLKQNSVFLAGIMCSPYKETKDGFESQMAVNYLGHFLLTHLLMPQIVVGSNDNDGNNARIVNVSSCVHKFTDIDYDDFHCK